MKIRRLLIANRGEILRRIAITARQLDIETVTIHQDPSPLSKILGEVLDKVVLVETNAGPSIYLDAKKLIEIAQAEHCDAVHPGFGFLSESADFAKACTAAGLIWVGPHPDSMTAMASKDTSRSLAMRSGVPVNQALQGFDPVNDLAQPENFAKKVGYPVLVKAAMGGGGKGMRLVERAEQLAESIARAHSEAKSSFGDGTLLIEKYITAPRHVEVQILGDKHGNVYAIGDRDCSIQRRHQKIIEEAPAPGLDQSTRTAMQAAAVALAKDVDYDSVGTVEFLVNAVGGRDKTPFYFLEMNTRLQVEHPVTEEVFGIDLVAWQLRVAAGEKLPDFSAIQPRGHAVEARVYAEDCDNQFLPCPGPIHDFRPAGGPGLRWETGIDRCDAVSETYDPMIAKAVAFGASRRGAFARLSDSLKRTALFGTTTNLTYLIALIEHPVFEKGAVTTHFLAEQQASLAEAIAERRHQAAALYDSCTTGINALFIDAKAPATATPISTRRQAIFGQNQPNLSASTGPEHFTNLESYQTKAGGILSGTLQMSGKAINFCVFRDLKSTSTWFNLDGIIYHDKLTKVSLSQYMDEQAHEGNIAAPVPGKVIMVKADAGQSVQVGQVILVLESMKLEFEVKADRDGDIAHIHVAAGDQVGAGDKLVSWNVD